MRYVLILATVLAIGSATRASAQAVRIYADTLGISCQINDLGVQERHLYLMLTGHGADVSGIRFRLESSNLAMIYLSEEHYVPVVGGDLRSGITYCYPGGLPNPTILSRITYMQTGASPECGVITVVPHPDSDTIDVVYRDGALWHSYGSRFYINNVGCGPQCTGGIFYGPSDNPVDFCGTVSAEETTWGAVKRLYR